MADSQPATIVKDGVKYIQADPINRPNVYYKQYPSGHIERGTYYTRETQQTHIESAVTEAKKSLPEGAVVTNVDTSRFEATGEIGIEYHQPNVYLDAYGQPVSVPPEKLEQFKEQYSKDFYTTVKVPHYDPLTKVYTSSTGKKYSVAPKDVQKFSMREPSIITMPSVITYKGVSPQEAKAMREAEAIRKADELFERNIRPVGDAQEWVESKTRFLEPKVTDTGVKSFFKSGGRAIRDIGVGTAFFPWTFGSIVGNIIITPKSEVKKRFKEGWQLTKQDIKKIPKTFKEKPAQSAGYTVATATLLFLPFKFRGKAFKVTKKPMSYKAYMTRFKGKGVELSKTIKQTKLMFQGKQYPAGAILKTKPVSRVYTRVGKEFADALTKGVKTGIRGKKSIPVSRSFLERVRVGATTKGGLPQGINVYHTTAVSPKGEVMSNLAMGRYSVYAVHKAAKSQASATIAKIVNQFGTKKVASAKVYGRELTSATMPFKSDKLGVSALTIRNLLVGQKGKKSVALGKFRLASFEERFPQIKGDVGTRYFQQYRPKPAGVKPKGTELFLKMKEQPKGVKAMPKSTRARIKTMTRILEESGKMSAKTTTTMRVPTITLFPKVKVRTGHLFGTPVKTIQRQVTPTRITNVLLTPVQTRKTIRRQVLTKRQVTQPKITRTREAPIQPFIPVPTSTRTISPRLPPFAFLSFGAKIGTATRKPKSEVQFMDELSRSGKVLRRMFGRRKK